MILIDDILSLHHNSILDFGGATGVRDSGLLESAIARPFQEFGGTGLYRTPIEKAAALGESLIANHPFVDGNKRTGLLAMATLLAEYGIEITANEEAVYDLIIAIATGIMSYEAIVGWLQTNTKPA